MEGWETRRHNHPNHDYCIISLGLPGIIRGLDIDTNHFHGNYGEYASLDAICKDHSSIDELIQSKEWVEILDKKQLQPGTPDKGHNYFKIDTNQRWSHVRLHMYPDGGIARLRVFGDVIPDWSFYEDDEIVNLAGIEAGCKVLASSNSYFSRKENLIMPGRGKNMGDGWETKRRRGPGHDWAVLKLGSLAYLYRILIDTAHFKGNYPDVAMLEAAYVKPDETWENSKWEEIIPRTKMTAHKEHFFKLDESKREKPFNHVRLNVFPDGGVSRLKVFGKRVILPQIVNLSVPHIEALPLTLQGYKPYGHVVETNKVKVDVVNQGTAQRSDWLANLENLRPGAKLNICTFQCQPRNLPFEIKLLEKHPYSTQMFIPMTAERRYLVIVAQGGDVPDISTLKCFVANKGQAITYHPGIWHHPMVALDKETTFCCFVYEDGSDKDCTVELLNKTIVCTVPF